MMFVFRVLLVLSLTTCLTGCDEPGSVLEKLGLADPPSPEPVRVALLLDTSLGSSCGPVGFEQTLDILLEGIADRPGSVVEIWELGHNLATTRFLAGRESAKPRGSGLKAQRGHKDRFLAEAGAYLRKTAEPVFNAPPKRRSPIAEGIARVALDRRDGDMSLLIVVLSDAREYSDFGDFECGVLPEDDEFLRSLHEAHVLTPASLAGGAVMFVNVTLEAVKGRTCAVTIERADRIEVLWTVALTTAGATIVEFYYGQLVGTAAGLFSFSSQGDGEDR
jgi:hypothetical protein